MHQAQRAHFAGSPTTAWLPAAMVVLGATFVACHGSADSATGGGGGTNGGGKASGGAASGGAASGGAASGGRATGGATSASGGAVGGRTTAGGGGATGGASGGSRTSAANGGNGSGGASGGAGSGGGTGGATTARPVGRPSAGCGLPGTSGRKDLTVTIRGVERTYRVQFPTPYAPDTPLPLVFYFHWLNGTVDDVVSLYEPAVWEVGNAGSEAAFVWPQGLAKYDNGLTGWDITCGGEDMEFFDAILGQLARDRCIDESRVFSTGFSFGADMSNALACCRGREVIRAVAPASGSVTPNVSCPAATTPAVRFSYGTKDTAYTQKDFQDVVTFYRTKLGCSTAYDPVSVAPCGKTWTGDASTVTCACKSYRNCEQPVIDCMFTNMPHTTAAGWRDDTWAFFSGFAAEN